MCFPLGRNSRWSAIGSTTSVRARNDYDCGRVRPSGSKRSLTSSSAILIIPQGISKTKCAFIKPRFLPHGGTMAASGYVLAIDQGTTSTRAILFDASGKARSVAQIDIAQHHPQPGWIEHDPEDIWRSVVATCREAAAAADGPIAAIGLANQRETTVLWERASGRPVRKAIVWQD